VIAQDAQDLRLRRCQPDNAKFACQTPVALALRRQDQVANELGLPHSTALASNNIGDMTVLTTDTLLIGSTACSFA